MGNIATPWSLAGCAGTILTVALLVSSLGADDPAPDRIPAVAVGPDLGPAPALAFCGAAGRPGRGSQYGSGPATIPATPAGENAGGHREEILPRRAIVVAVGANARSMCDPAFESGFASRAEELEVAFSCCSDRDAIELRMMNRVDLTLLGGTLSHRERAAGLRQTRIGLELFALAVATDFPIESLSLSRVRQLLTGQVRDWQQLGCDRGAVVVVTPSQRPIVERAARSLILGDSFSAAAIRVADDRQVADQLLRSPGAIAVVRVKNTPPAGMKLLQIDWTPPTAAAFGFGAYPYGVPLHVVTSGQPEASVARFLDYAKSPDGREVLGRTLLVP